MKRLVAIIVLLAAIIAVASLLSLVICYAWEGIKVLLFFLVCGAVILAFIDAINWAVKVVTAKKPKTYVRHKPTGFIGLLVKYDKDGNAYVLTWKDEQAWFPKDEIEILGTGSDTP